jgi:hypothetical protein
MTTQPLEIEIRRKGRKEASFKVTADPANPKELRDILTGWLTGNKWGRGKWDQFEAVAFADGTWTKLATVRA